MTIELPKPKKGKEVKPENIKFRLREDGAEEPVEVAIHPSSVNSREVRFDSQYLVFHEKVKTTRIYVRDCSTVRRGGRRGGSEGCCLLFARAPAALGEPRRLHSR